MFALAFSAALVCTSAAAIDGDTIRCANLGRVRLLGIDAPEMAGHCRRGRDCAPGAPLARKRAMTRALGASRITVEPIAHDRYNRVVGIVRAGRVNLSCAQLRGGLAVYKPQWDNGRRIAKECPDAQ